MSGYPPGVTGNEYAISGPSEEWEAKPDAECASCHWYDADDLVTYQYHISMGRWWICPNCNDSNDVEIEDPFDYESEGWDEKDDDYEDYDYGDYE